MLRQGQQLKCLTVVDEYSRECLAIDVAGSIGSSELRALRGPDGSGRQGNIDHCGRSSSVTSVYRWSSLGNRCEDRHRAVPASVQRGSTSSSLGQLTPAEFKQQLSVPQKRPFPKSAMARRMPAGQYELSRTSFERPGVQAGR